MTNDVALRTEQLRQNLTKLLALREDVGRATEQVRDVTRGQTTATWSDAPGVPEFVTAYRGALTSVSGTLVQIGERLDAMLVGLERSADAHARNDEQVAELLAKIVHRYDEDAAVGAGRRNELR